MAMGFLPILQLLSTFISLEYSFTILTILMGGLFLFFDMHIYMLFEGRRYWPKIIFNLFCGLEKERLAKLNKVIKSEYSKKNERVEAYYDIKNFPISDDGEYTVNFPTRLGNLMAAYEDYSLRIYGMDPVFYWPRIWLTLDKDIRDEINSQQALADSTIYSSTALFSSSLLCLLYALISIFHFPWLKNFPEAYVFLSLSSLGALFGYLIYRLSLYIHSQFGDTFKSVFDLEHEEIKFSGILDKISHIIDVPNLNKIKQDEKYKYIWRYLQYNLIKIGNAPPITPEKIKEIKMTSLKNYIIK
jgi:hypothetical protein